jgi:predicted methyltransferase
MKHPFALVCAVALAAGVGVAPMAAHAAPASDSTAVSLDQAVAGRWRTQASRARDQYRHPQATLQFFGLRPDQTVIEITPGGGWYSQIIAPMLQAHGHYIAAVQAPRSDQEAAADDSALHKLFAADPAHYGNARIVEFDPKAPVFGPPGSADRVLTFRNAHNWTQAGTANAMFKAFFDVLKPGGVLGVVDHRAAPNASYAPGKLGGYLPTDYVVKLATDAGFKLDASSEINANPKDDRNHPKGVWTLPPTMAMGSKDAAKYRAIGESDRMTLRFVKPATPAMAAAGH